MRFIKNSTAFAVLRVVIICCLAAIFLASAAVGVLQGTIFSAGVSAMNAREGVLDLRGELSTREMIYLSGEWAYYPNVFAVGERFNPQLLEDAPAQKAVLPLNDVEQAIGPGTYRLRIQTDQPISGYAFYVEHYDEDFAIYVDGKRVQPVWGGQPEKVLYSLSDYLFRIDTPVPAGEIEILISANSNLDQSLLYRNEVLFGPSDDVTDYVVRIWRDNTFLIGMILIMVTMGLVFVLIRTKFDMLTSIALFDTLLAIRILLGYSVATYFFHNLFPGIKFGNVDFVGLQYVAFFFTGAFGCVLSQSIFDAERRTLARAIKVQIVVCAVGGIFTLFFFRYLPKLCVGLLFVTLLGSFLIVTRHVCKLIAEKRMNRYYLFQTVKTYYVGGIMAFDILYLWGTSYNLLIYTYIIFFLAHLAARLIDSNASYQETEKLNRNLEQMIEERTSELTETNCRLSELSVRDPLTQAHNRLYFEEEMERVLRQSAGVPVFLCMFDLDFFKSINDRFGHVAGDEQLKFVVSEVNRILGDHGTLSRIGGEEFVILFEGESKGEVLHLIEQMRRRLEEDAKSNEKRTTASFGLVRCRDGESSKDIMRATDRCLYSAKKMGRNCLVMR